MIRDQFGEFPKDMVNSSGGGAELHQRGYVDIQPVYYGASHCSSALFRSAFLFEVSSHTGIVLWVFSVLCFSSVQIFPAQQR